jgi:hypothetical protein
VLQWFGWGIAACFRSKASLVAENLCLRQQLLVLHRRQARGRLRDADRRFWIVACRWFASWRHSLLIVKPEAVLRWHRRGWKAYWRWRSKGTGLRGRRPIAPKLQVLIQRIVGSAKDPGGADQVRVQRLCPNGCQVYAASAGQGAVSRLA